MKKLILNLAFIILTISIISSCQKETMNVDANAPELAQADLNGMNDLAANALQYKALAEKNQEKTEAELHVLKLKIEALKAERAQRFGNQEVSSRSVNGIIRVPQDYPSLQLAVDNSQSGGKIFIQGTVSEPGDVLVDVPGLTIQGQGSSPTINGSTLVITAADTKVQNLTVNMATVISGTSGTKLMNSTFSATNNTGAMGPLVVLNSSNNSIKNCTIDGAYEGGSHEFGLFMDYLSNQNEVENCTSKNTFGVVNQRYSAAFAIDGANNQIHNCTALNFTRGFSSIGNSSNNNQFKGCVANGSVNDAGFVFLSVGNNLQLEHCIANNNASIGFFIDGGVIEATECTANSNNFAGIYLQFGSFNIKESSTLNNNKFGMLIVDYNPNTGEFFNHTGTLEKNTTESNGWLGIYLLGLNNSYIIDNTSTGNPVCDFNQTLCSGNTVSGNNFGTSCTNL
jgi:parallel beta-helix repeat protein